MRGERPVFPRGRLADDGSSPHARGTHDDRRRSPPHRRFIPACAGNAINVDTRKVVKTVHPRMRGERIAIHRSIYLSIGSSPHTRGTLNKPKWKGKVYRFIPAYAGNAVRASVCAVLMAVHPRIRGERAINRAVVKTLRGSSPHTRGTHSCSGKLARCSRFIPAYAGNASGYLSRKSGSTVHPRIRGERSVTGRRLVRFVGSSPHTRGTREDGICILDVKRFIPAYAGNAATERRSRFGMPVHPRIRGERTSSKLLI